MQSAFATPAHTRGESMAAAGSATTIVLRTGHVIQRHWRAYWRCRTQRAAVLMLQALDDRTLADIGLSRSEILPAVYGGGGRPPRNFRRS
jgi:uncharacterized protein YjiS (DUF1127 family)